MADPSATIVQIVSGDLWGGAEAQVLVQSRALRAAGWKIELLVFNQGEALDKYREAGIRTHLVPEDLGLFRFLNAARRIVAARGPRLLVAHGYKEASVAFLLRLVAGIPWVATLHGAAEPATGLAALKSRLYLGVYRLIARWSAARVIAVSSAVARAWKVEDLPGLRVVHNAAETAALPADAARPTHSVDGRPALICVGRLAPVKRYHLAIAALARLRREPGLNEATLTLVGEGPERASLERLARDLECEGAVRFLGYRRDVSALLRGSDILLMTSSSEGLPTVLLEAISVGLPAVSTDVGGIREVLETFPGYPFVLVSKDDHDGVSSAVAEAWRVFMAAPPLDRDRILATFREHFAPEATARQLARIFRELLSGTDEASGTAGGAFPRLRS
jgi:L-malate glycosyltransferase